MKTATAFMVIILGSAAPAFADTRDEVLAGVARCGVIHDDRVWLDCVYGAQQPMRAKLGLSPAPELQQRLVPAMGVVPPPSPIAGPPVKKQNFFERMVATEMDTAPRMKAYHFEKDGAFVVQLENGEEYRQTDTESGKAAWSRKPSAYRVVVSEAAFGGYKLRTSDGPHIYKVARIH